jgi:hypothetical protein
LRSTPGRAAERGASGKRPDTQSNMPPELAERRLVSAGNVGQTGESLERENGASNGAASPAMQGVTGCLAFVCPVG